MPLETNFNAAPYFDDFNANNNYYRVLFKPAVAVQARELTQLQTILQDQIDKFGRHIFKDGSVVEGCTLNFDDNYSYVKITDTAIGGAPINVSDFVGATLRSTSNLQALIVNSVAGLETNSPDLNTFYVRYLNSAVYPNGSQQKTYDPDEPLQILRNGTNVSNVAVANSIYTPVGNGYAVSIGEGTVFNKGFFVRVAPQTVVVSKYSSTPANVSVGFVTTESVITADSDSSLFDNALGSTNFSAPGANRLKLTATLSVRARDVVGATTANTTNFFTVVDFGDGKPVIKLTDPQYAVLGTEMARRTYEESGNYIVDPFELSVSTNATSSSNLVLEISRGTGYVQGYRVEYSDKVRANIRKGMDTVYFPNQIVTANYGDYVIVNEVAGSFDIKNSDDVSLHSTTAVAKVTAGNYVTSDPAPANQIGTAKIRSIEYDSGIPGTPTCQYRLYLFDIRITGNGNSFSDVRTIYATDGTSAAFADPVLVSGNAVLRETGSPDLVFSLGSRAIETINTTATSFVFNARITAQINTAGIAVFTVPTSHPGGTDRISVTGSLSEQNELKFIVVPNTAVRATNSSGSATITSTSNVITGSGTTFNTEYVVGDWVYVGNTTAFGIGRVSSIANATQMTTANPFSTSLSANGISRFFPAGVPISFTRDDSANVVISGDGTQATFNLGTNLTAAVTSVITYDCNRSAAIQANKEIRKNRFVSIQANTHPSRNQGPWSLGLPDVTRIRGIYQGTTFATTNPEVSRFFTLDTGQRSGLYGLASISIKPNSGYSIGANDRLLVELDHFEKNESGGIGYYSIGSYPIRDPVANSTTITTPEIPVFTSETGISYDLRDSIDFRPYTSNTAVSSTTAGGATVNPAATNGLAINPSGAYAPAPDTNFNTAFSYYLGRKDKVALSQDGNINVIEGAPATIPTSPRDQDGTMTLGVLTIPPFPSLSQSDVRLFGRPEYGVTIDLQQYRRYTMRDIGVLDKKIARLEYYTTLSLLETSAKTLTVKDAAGLDRFKNGFIVDPFNGFTVSDTKSPEFKAGIDVKMKELAPTIKRSYVDLDFDSSASTNVERDGSLITLVGSTVSYIEQPFASKTRNCVENILYVWNGNITLSPEGDIRPDIDRAPDVVGNIDLSGITDFINSMPNLIGTERVISSTSIDARVTTSEEEIRNGRQILTFSNTTRDLIARTTDTTQRENLDFSASNQTNTFDFGELVQDVSIQTFIRPRRINFAGSNLKPNTTLFAYFDGVAVSVHCTPTNSSYVATGAKGGSLVSDANGIVYGYFDVPAGIFKTGDRVFRLCDTNDIDVAASAITTQAAGTYSASNISITKARYGLNTRVPQIAVSSSFVNTGSVTSSRVISSEVVNRELVRVHDPICQTFFITEAEEDTGVFIKKIDLYFRSKHPTLGVELQIREVENGSPTVKILPFGRKVLTAAEVLTSTDATAVTSFNFDSPVFLQSGREYCFVVMPVGSNDGYNIWVGELGETDITTGSPIYVNNSTGVLFTSSTNRVWTPFQKEDIKFVIHRKNFTASSGTITYRNTNTEFMTANNFGGQFTVGERVFVSTAAGHAITGNAGVNTTSTAVSVVANATSVASVMFTNNTLVFITSANSQVSIVRLITSIPNASHIIVNTVPTFVDSAASVGSLYANGGLFGTLTRVAPEISTFVLDGSSANNTVGFGNVVTGTANAVLIGSESRAKANLVSVDNISYSTIVPQFSYCSPIGTSVSIRMKGFDGTANDATLTGMTGDIETFFSDKERIVMSRSNELSAGGRKTFEVQIPITSASNKASPFFDDIKSDVVAIENIVGPQIELANEATAGGGAVSAKYVSKRVILAEGQDAEDLKVYLTGYRPSNTELTVYTKLLNGEDSETIDAKNWSPMLMTTSSATVSSRVDRNDFREFVYDLPGRSAINVAVTSSLSDYSVYGTFTNANVSANVITVSNTTPLGIGSLIYYVGNAAVGIANGFYNIFTANTTAVRLSNPGGAAELTITPAAGGTGALYFVPLTAFKDRSTSNVASYYTRSGALFHSYKTFSIKIAMTSEEGSHIVPRVADMRAIALQA